MKSTLPSRSERRTARQAKQAEREARKFANSREFKPGEATLLYTDENGHGVYLMHPVHIPGYTYAF